MCEHTNIVDLINDGSDISSLSELIKDFAEACDPSERSRILLMQDKRTSAKYIECHILASKLVPLSTIDVPLDPEEQAEYRANRDVVEDHVAFERMKEDALLHRTFSNIVCEFTRSFDSDHPIKIIGGQHRYTAIKDALSKGVDELHGIKLYFDLDTDQRIDTQLISNTNIAVSTDLFDRMQETLAGPQLREWCQAVGLLEPKQDFADKRARANPVTVRAARSFIINYFRGAEVDPKNFDATETIPLLAKSGANDGEWDALKKAKPGLWTDAKLIAAGKAYVKLIDAQRLAFTPAKPGQKNKGQQADFAEKALNFAVLSAWAFVAGVLRDNQVRLDRHFGLADQAGKDPLAAAALAKGRHRTDPENYRGLGYRTDGKERGRLVELFFIQAEDGGGINTGKIDLAIKKFHAKEAHLEVAKAAAKASA